jgi:hypothetical protein
LVNLGEEFVAVPLGKGLTVEGQLTGSEVCLKSWNSGNCSNLAFQQTQGGVQIDVFPLVQLTVSFYPQENPPTPKFYDIYRTPRQLGFSVGEYFWMKNFRYVCAVLSSRFLM